MEKNLYKFWLIFLVLLLYMTCTVNSRYIEVVGTIFTSSNYPKCKLICTSGLENSLKRQIMVGESNQNVDASSFAEFEISEFEISRVDCMWTYWNKILFKPMYHSNDIPHWFLHIVIWNSFVTSSSHFIWKLCAFVASS